MDVEYFGMKHSFLRLWAAVAASIITSLSGAGLAHAQTFTNTTDAAINDTTRCGTTNVVRNFSVTGVGTVDDLNVGFLATHFWRGDILMTLQSPAPTATTVTLIASDTSNAGNDDDYNILLNDQGDEVLNVDDADGPHDTTLPLYQHDVTPSNPLSAFTGQNANGTWVMTMCDDFGGQDGNFLEASLIFSMPTGADLSLAASTATLLPEIGSSTSFTYTLNNAGPEAATGVTAQIDIPAGFTAISSSGAGTFNSATGLWTLPASLASSSSSVLTVTATIAPTGPYTVDGEITASSETDPDSTPNNSSTTEDDDDSLPFTPIPSTTPPSLTCPIVDQFSHLWGAPGTTNGWPAGDLTNSYTAGGEPIIVTMTGDTNRLIARTFGGVTSQTPVSTTQFANGANTGEYGIVMNVDYAATTESILTTMNFGTVGTGVGQVQFQILDIDLNTWTDRIVITGTLGGVPVTPILTSSGANTVSTPNTFLGTASAATGSATGNTTITFLSPVDTITFLYDNASTTANPIAQVISLQKFVMCPSLSADLTAVKSVEVYDPANAGLYMTPGNEVLYRITVTFYRLDNLKLRSEDACSHTIKNT